MEYDSLLKVSGLYRRNVPMGGMTWFQVGGIAEVLLKPRDIEDLAAFIKGTDLAVHVVGMASNLIIRDGIVRGVVVRLGKGFTEMYCEGSTITAGCASLLGNLSIFAKNHGISGLEFFTGIPGTVGGAVAMNAGAYGGEVASVLQSVVALDERGDVQVLSNADMKYVYRGNGLEGNWIFVEAKFVGVSSDEAAIGKTMSEYIAKRNASQPVRRRTGGSTFKNPPGNSAWKLIDQAKCRGLQMGGAQVSQQHCNFLLNQCNATAKDLEDLGNEVRYRVRSLCGVNLEWEIRFLGDEFAG